MRSLGLLVLALATLSGCDWAEGGPGELALRLGTRWCRCPVVPLRLVLERPGERALTVLRLRPDGGLEVPLAAGSVARLDPRGCLWAADGVWVEETREGDLWTLRGITEVREGGLRIGERLLRIRDDGAVADDPPQPPVPGVGTFRFEGYGPDAACAARILLQAWLAMMPSMAVSDGHPVALPPPAASVCPDRHPRPGT